MKYLKKQLASLVFCFVAFVVFTAALGEQPVEVEPVELDGSLAGIAELTAERCEAPVAMAVSNLNVRSSIIEQERFSVVDGAIALAGKGMLPVVENHEQDAVVEVVEPEFEPEPEVEPEVVQEDMPADVQYDSLAWENIPEKSDLWWLAKLIHAEAEGEPWEGKIAVGNVVLNRVDSWRFPDTIVDVIFQRNQFSVVGNRLNLDPNQESINAAAAVLNGEKASGMTPYVLYFNAVAPEWWPGVEYWRTIGGHYFATQE